MTSPEAPVVADTLEQVWRGHWGRLLALLVAQYRRLDLAEDGLGDAFEAAARHWPTEGMPDSPAAWLLTAARRRVLDRLRSEAVAARKEPLLVVDAELQESAQRAMADPGDLTDERLRLVLLCAHPALAPESASALSLRLVLGVTTRDIARLFLVSEPTMAARLTRARKKLVVAGVPFAVPEAARLPGRLETVAQVAYLGFTAGYAPGSGSDVTRVDVAGEAVRLGHVLHELLPDESLLTALLALMTLQHSRRDARVDERGDLVLLPDQDRTTWRHDEIAAALDLLTPMVSGAVAEPEGLARSYLLQALIAAEHVTAATAGETSWPRIADLYVELEAHTGSPVVRLNRAVAVAEAVGPRAGLMLLEGLEIPLGGNHRLPATRAELLGRLGERAAAGTAYEEAIALCGNAVERAHLVARRARLG